MSLQRRHFGLATAAYAGAVRGAEPLRVAGGRDAADRRYDFSHALLQAALAAAGRPVALHIVAGMSLSRIARSLGTGSLDLAMLPAIQPPGEALPHLDWPIRQGLLGLRLLLAREDRAAALSRVQSVPELQRDFSLGYGSDWPDLPLLQRLGFRTVVGSSYAGLFQMLATGRFDYLSRGVNEVWAELDTAGRVPPGVVLVPRLALFYPLDDQFHASPQAAHWLQPLLMGLQTLWKSGRYARLFRWHYGPAWDRAQLAARQVLQLAGYRGDAEATLRQFQQLAQTAQRAAA
jgi:hypothetical protein